MLKNKLKPLITLETKLSFGKYKGYVVKDLIPEVETEEGARLVDDKAKYFMWVHAKTDWKIGQDVKDRVTHIKKLYPTPLPQIRDSSGYDRNVGQDSAYGRDDLSFTEMFGTFGY